MDLLNSVTGSKKPTSESIHASYRFDLSLKTSADADCPEFSFIELVREKVKVRLTCVDNSWKVVAPTVGTCSGH